MQCGLICKYIKQHAWLFILGLFVLFILYKLGIDPEWLAVIVSIAALLVTINFAKEQIEIARNSALFNQFQADLKETLNSFSKMNQNFYNDFNTTINDIEYRQDLGFSEKIKLLEDKYLIRNFDDKLILCNWWLSEQHNNELNLIKNKYEIFFIFVDKYLSELKEVGHLDAPCRFIFSNMQLSFNEIDCNEKLLNELDEFVGKIAKEKKLSN